MAALKVILTIIFLLVCVALIGLVLLQEGKSGALSGGSETFWSKNKSRSAEGKLELLTKILGAAFIVLAIVLNLF